ncbi:RNA polymerase factor sigma-54 [Sansalvadorimonas sp. 2012CJ34-2]|uniref:RNA polymerase sigma-54 factor n=1 Tax=Parendozoicomonas callyspongiae TaxID=2942213 RepID=A0ABT0PBY7_9GAMM|nr:RNA polymerase factor sigma-54 [Sansalvadorimonas sp. 2012CJ34-2]MCL6268894.1 RNA polymerase factor sigma-54 [Sansalvadorimonas sp. 2012CJ34-2]
MKPSLELKIGQQLTMTPQLQQAIRLLQLSTLDLQQEIQQALESNPMLEQDEQNSTDSEPGSQEALSEAGLTDLNSVSSQEKRDETQETQDDWNNEIPTDLPVDSVWDDVYQSSPSSGNGTSSDSQPDDFTARTSASETLQDHLEWQLTLTPMSATDRMIGMSIIEAIDDNGYLTVSLEEILSGFTQEDDVEMDEVEMMLHRIQYFDPVGVGARDLRECLILQLHQLPEATEDVIAAHRILDRYIDLLGTRDYATLMRRTRMKEDQLRNALAIIQSLNPHPGASLQTSEAEYVVPDVMVRKAKGRWIVELNPDTSPRLRINDNYASLIRRADSSADNTYLKSHLQEARWFIKSLQSRNETLLKVATRIVEHQQGFLEYGEEAMKPLVLHDIAEAVEMHESTISRVTTQKFMHTPRGIFELKYFFSSHVSTSSGGECSSTAIRALIKKLVAQENPKKPLSDSKIAALLGEQGIQVARRTIAKYREAMAIPPSNERKRLI